MKKGIHPKVYKDVVVTCACGNKFTTISTLDEIRVEICGECHPFYTGQQKFVDTEGRIDKFKKKVEISRERQKQAQERKSKASKGKKEIKDESKRLPTIKEMLEQARGS